MIPLMKKRFDFLSLRMLRTALKLTNGVENSMRNIKLKIQSPRPPLHELMTIKPYDPIVRSKYEKSRIKLYTSKVDTTYEHVMEYHELSNLNVLPKRWHCLIVDSHRAKEA